MENLLIDYGNSLVYIIMITLNLAVIAVIYVHYHITNINIIMLLNKLVNTKTIILHNSWQRLHKQYTEHTSSIQPPT